MTTEFKCPCHCIISRVHTISTTYHCWCQPWSLGWGSVCRVFPLWGHSFFPFPHCAVWKDVSKHSPHLSVGVILHLPEGDYLQNFFGILQKRLASLSTETVLKFIQSLNLYGLQSNTCLFCCSNCSNIGYWVLFQLHPASLWHTTIIVSVSVREHVCALCEEHCVCRCECMWECTCVGVSVCVCWAHPYFWHHRILQVHLKSLLPQPQNQYGWLHSNQQDLHPTFDTFYTWDSCPAPGSQCC